MTLLNDGGGNGEGDDLLNDLLQDALDEYKERQRRRDNPYVADMINVLAPHGANGAPRRAVVDKVGAFRMAKSLPIPAKFDSNRVGYAYRVTIQENPDEPALRTITLHSANGLLDLIDELKDLTEK